MQKWKMSEKGLQIPEKKREAKAKGEKEIYTKLMQTSKEYQKVIRKPF